MNLNTALKNQHRIYRVAALPIAAVFAFVLHTPGGLTWLQAGILGFGMAVIGELISLPAWYSCRIAPIQRTLIWRLLATHLVAAQILSLLWLGAGIPLAQEATHEVEARAMQTSIQARDAELKALKAQINPHFLFNSLNSISALTSIDPVRARDMCVLLGDFLRLTLGLGEKTSVRF